MAVISLAYRPPRSVSDFRDVRGLEPKYQREPGAEELLRVVEQGRVMSPDQLRLPPHDTADSAQRATVTLVAAWISQRARTLNLDPGVVASRSDIESLLTGRGSGRLSAGWRRELVGEPVRRLAAGDVAVAFEGGSLVLEERSYRRISAADDGTTPA